MELINKAGNPAFALPTRPSGRKPPTSVSERFPNGRTGRGEGVGGGVCGSVDIGGGSCHYRAGRGGGRARPDSDTCIRPPSVRRPSILRPPSVGPPRPFSFSRPAALHRSPWATASWPLRVPSESTTRTPSAAVPPPVPGHVRVLPPASRSRSEPACRVPARQQWVREELAGGRGGAVAEAWVCTARNRSLLGGDSPARRRHRPS